jgi:endonuclease/exonuclease/phosphatase family metal-dependent hydrolase
MASGWQFELGRARATARLGYDLLWSLLRPVRETAAPGRHDDAPTVATNCDSGGAGQLPERLRLVSWNIHRGYDARGVVESLRSLMAHRDPHLLLLQEVPVYPHGSWWLEPDVAELLTGMHLVFAVMHRVVRPSAYYPFQGAGLLIGLRTRPAVHRALRLPVVSRPKLGRNHRIERIALGVCCQAGATTPQIWNLHLENTARPSGRTRQAAALAAALGNGPLIVGGDVNTLFGPLEGVAATFEAAGLRRIPLRHGRWLSPSIDHIFVRGASRAAGEVLRLPGSDHFPIFAEVEFAAAQPGAE